MNTPHKIIVTLAAAATLSLTLAGCFVNTAEPEATASTTPAAAAPAPAPAADVCEGRTPARDYGANAEASGNLGEFTDAGTPGLYITTAGDTVEGVAERFCVAEDELRTINSLGNGSFTAGDKLALVEGKRIAALRENGVNFPACPVDASGNAIVATPDSGKPVDSGAQYTANGSTDTDAEGAVVAYTVADGDSWRGIMNRLCVDADYVDTTLGGQVDLHPGDVLELRL